MRARYVAAHVHHDHQRCADRQRCHRRSHQHAAADGENQEEGPGELSQITVHVVSCRRWCIRKDAPYACALYRRETGITNFSAVCVSEKRATFISTRPAALPAFLTSPSEISGLPFGRITQIAPSRLRNFCTVTRRSRSLCSLAATKITSTGPVPRARTVAPHVWISSRSVSSRTPTNSTR